MEYKFYEIGERVRNLRKNQGQSQSEFIGMLKDKYNVSISRNRLSSIENGNQKDFSLEFLLAVCQEYDCNMGFLFGEYQEKTYNNHFICIFNIFWCFSIRIIYYASTRSLYPAFKTA